MIDQENLKREIMEATRAALPGSSIWSVHILGNGSGDGRWSQVVVVSRDGVNPNDQYLAGIKNYGVLSVTTYSGLQMNFPVKDISGWSVLHVIDVPGTVPGQMDKPPRK